MSIEKYKAEIIKLINAMEEEHGCTVRKVEYEKTQDVRVFSWPQMNYKLFQLTIEVE